MAIQALAAAAIQAVGASQVLLDPAAAVKELVDNSLDAHASAVAVDLSSDIDALHVIQVRDNGHGIAPLDRPLLCRPHCTSKLATHEQLRALGASSLGFRGQALAAAAQLCRSLSITTRVDGEQLAVALKFGLDGAVSGQDRVSHPIGTTVRLDRLFHAVPVRRQHTSPPKSLAKIKRLLQSYALARPTVRFSLRLLKTGDAKAGDWIYAPSTGANALQDAARKVVGKDCAGQCSSTTVELDGYTVTAFIPRPDADASKIAGVGCFLSVDARPVSGLRGTLKFVVTQYRQRLRASNPRFDKVRDPFAWINIACPPESYDVNVEPAKDDVLFEDSTKPLAAVETLLSQFYPSPSPRSTGRVSPPVTSPSQVISILEDQDSFIVIEPSSKRRRLSSCPDFDNEGNDDQLGIENRNVAHLDSDDEEATATPLRNVKVSNPWVMAKMNASVKPKSSIAASNGKLPSPLHERNHFETNLASTPERVRFPPFPPWQVLSPVSSPFRGNAPNDEARATFEASGDSSSAKAPLIQQASRTNESPLQEKRKRQSYSGFVSTGQPPLGNLVHEHPSPVTDDSPAPRKRNQTRRREHQFRNKPFVPPVRDESRVWFEAKPPESSPCKRPSTNARVRQNMDIRAFTSTVTRPTEETDGLELPRVVQTVPRRAVERASGTDMCLPTMALDSPDLVTRQGDEHAAFTEYFHARAARASHVPAAQELVHDESSAERNDEYDSAEASRAQGGLLEPSAATTVRHLLQTARLSVPTLELLSQKSTRMHRRVKGHVGYEAWEQRVSCADVSSPHGDILDNVHRAGQLREASINHVDVTAEGDGSASSGGVTSALTSPPVDRAEVQRWRKRLLQALGDELDAEVGEGALRGREGSGRVVAADMTVDGMFDAIRQHALRFS